MNKEEIEFLRKIKLELSNLIDIAELKKEEEKPKEKLHAVVEHEHIVFLYKGEQLGFIKSNGECHILNTGYRINAYNQWREDGMPLDTESIIEWRGGKYGFNHFWQFERKDIEDGEIYDFGDCYYISNCRDDNIKRFGHNNRPIGY